MDLGDGEASLVYGERPCLWLKQDKESHSNLVWWPTAIPALGRLKLRWVDCAFEASLGYVASSNPVWAE